MFLRHELAHALDRQESDLSDQHPGLERLARDLPRDEGHDGRREAFANVCETGPFGALLLSEGDCGVDPTISAVGGWLSSSVWSGYDAPELVEQGPTEAVYRDGPEFWYFKVHPTESPDRIALEQLGHEETVRTTVDLHSGAVVEPEPELPIDHAPPILTDGGLMVDRRGWSNGPGLGLVRFQFEPVGNLPLRLAWFDGERWHPVSGCVDDLWGLFTAEGRVWSSAGDGRAVWWRPVP